MSQKLLCNLNLFLKLGKSLFEGHRVLFFIEQAVVSICKQKLKLAIVTGHLSTYIYAI
jgi:hypothetical protein